MERRTESKGSETPAEYTLKHRWCLWERRLGKAMQNRKNFSKQNKKMYAFGSLGGLAQLFRHTPYGRPSNFFFDAERGLAKRVVCPGEEEAAVESLMLFKEGIEPEWEDPVNAKGGSFVLELSLAERPARLDEIWRAVVFALVGHRFPFCELVTGCRFMDRLRRQKNIKLELWTSIPFRHGDDSEQGRAARKQKERFTTAFAQLVAPVFPGVSENLIIFKCHDRQLKA